MKYSLVIILLFSLTEAKPQDSLNVSLLTDEILLADSSSLLPVLQNRIDNILSPALYVQNKGAMQLSLDPQLEFNNWYNPGLPFDYQVPKQWIDSTVTEANYSYGLNDSHLFGASYRDKIGKNYVSLNYIRNTSTGLLSNTDFKESSFQIEVAKDDGAWRYEFGFRNLKTTVSENGGIDSLFLTEAEEVNSFTIPAHLNTASNELRSQQAYFDNTYYFIRNESLAIDSLDTIAISPKYSHGLICNIGIDKSQFTYEMGQADIDSVFYEKVLSDSLETRDSIGYIGVNYSLGYVVLDTLDRERIKVYYNNTSYDWTALDEASLNLKLHSYLYGHTTMQGRYFVSGYRKSYRELILSHHLKYKRNLIFNVNISNTKGQPMYELLRYQGNHYEWNNSFKDQEVTKAKFRMFQNKLKIGADFEFQRLNNHVFLNFSSVPEQMLMSFDYFKVSLYHLYQSKFLRLYTKGTYQKGTSDVIRFPKFSLSSTLVYAFKLGKLKASLGTQASYFTSFKGMAYNPNLRQLVLQDRKLVGGFPLIDAFAALKVGGADVFVKWENILFGTYSREFYLYPDYIAAPRMIRVGLNWKFLN